MITICEGLLDPADPRTVCVRGDSPPGPTSQRGESVQRPARAFCATGKALQSTFPVCAFRGKITVSISFSRNYLGPPASLDMTGCRTDSFQTVHLVKYLSWFKVFFFFFNTIRNMHSLETKSVLFVNISNSRPCQDFCNILSPKQTLWHFVADDVCHC